MNIVRIPRRVVRKNKLASAMSRGDEQPWIDKFLQRLAHISQLGLLALGAFGYFYTVKPVFQYQQLQEQTAKLDIEKAAAERQLLSLTTQQDKVKENIQLLQENWKQKRARSARLAIDAFKANERESEARRQISETETVLQRQLKSLDASRWELIFLDLLFAKTLTNIKYIDQDFNSEKSKEPGDFILLLEARWKSPYEDLLMAVDTISRNGGKRQDIPETYYSELRNFIVSNASNLNCNKPDFAAIHKEYLTEIASLDPIIGKELDHYIESIQNEYAEKGENVRITDDFRSMSRRSLRAGKVFTVDSAYRQKLKSLRNICEERIDRVLTDIKKAKEVMW